MAQLHYISERAGGRRRGRAAGGPRGNYYSQRSETFFFEYVREQLIDRYGKNTVEQGGLKVYTTINLNMQRLARKAIARSSQPARRPRLGDRHAQPRQRRHRGDGGVRELREVAVQPRRRRPPPAGLDVQGDRPRRRALARDRPEQHLLPLAHAPAGLAAGLPDLRSQDLRGHLPEQVDQPRPGDARLRQHRLRPARGRPRRGNGHPDGLQDGRQDPPLELPRRGAGRSRPSA